ncbi:MAG: homoserine dehydrogenase [Lachnospiraceae bacterium]|nr:homoserine dehydrogenase [Lachnospiraceae bacterium]
MKQVAVFGYGTVGSGVVEVIDRNSAVIEKRVGEKLNVKYILDLRDFPGDPNESKVVHDINVILDDPEVEIVCETMGGNEPAFTYSKNALLKGKSVCTSNKELVANHGPELLKLAKENNCNYLFEASVGGGIPVIRTINEALTAEIIDGITGILNGTTNYILTKMDREGAKFDDVLKQAQDLGYAEKNPEADVEGYDACRKIAILSSLMTGHYVHFEDIYTEGITKITPEDFKYAKALNCTIKLLAMSKENNGSYYAMVAPFLIGKDTALYNVNDVFNAVFVHSNMLDDSMYYGRGAGKLATASAVVGDVIEAAKNTGKNLPIFWDDTKVNLLGIGEVNRSFLVRVKEAECDKKEISAAFGEVTYVTDAGVAGEIGFVTPMMKEKDFEAKLNNLSGVIGRIRLDK